MERIYQDGSDDWNISDFRLRQYFNEIKGEGELWEGKDLLQVI